MMGFRKTVLFMLLFCMLLSAVPAAYAAGYRLKESVCGAERNANGLLTMKYMDGGEYYYSYRYETDANGNVSRMTASFSDGGTEVTEYRYEKVN